MNTLNLSALEAQFADFTPPVDVPGMTIEHLRQGIAFFRSQNGIPVIWKRTPCFILVATRADVAPVLPLLDPVPGMPNSYYLPVNV